MAPEEDVLLVDGLDRQVTVEFDVIDADDRALLGRIELVAYANGITIGDEIMCRLRVLEELL